MASIWKHPNSRFWTACYTDSSGRQRKRTTKQTDKQKALTVALELERAESNAKASLLTEVQCRKLLSEILERTTGDSIRHVATNDYLRDWLAGKEVLGKVRTAERYRNTVELFLKHLGERAAKPLTALAPRDVQGFLTARLKSGVATKTASVDIKSLRSAFSTARRQGLISNSPADAVELPKVESSERGVFTTAQVGMLVNEAEGEWRTLILLGFYTGARLSDCVGLTWDSINLTAGTLAYQQQKTGKKVTVPLHPDLAAHLEKLAGSDTLEARLCPTLADKNTGGAHGLSATFKALMRKAGLDPHEGKGQGNRSFSKFTFHSLRHSFNSALANAGVAQELRQKLTGHTSAQMNARYTHHELAPLKAAVGKLPSLAGR